MPYICPECREEIDSLHFREYGYYFGTCDPTGDDAEQQEFNEDGDLEYSCPNCCENILLEDVEYNEENETRAYLSTTTTLPPPPIEDNQIRVPRESERMFDESKSHIYASVNRNFFACKKCNLKYEFDDGETEITCNNCGELITKN